MGIYKMAKKNHILKEIPNHSGYYASREGLIFSNRAGLFKELKRGINPLNGYLQVHLKHKTYRVSRLVALTWIPNPDNKPCVCHKNNTRTDNRIENLYWGTAKENTQQCIGDQRFRPRGKIPLKIEEKQALIQDYLRGVSRKDLRVKYSLKNTRITHILKEANVARVQGNNHLHFSGALEKALEAYINSSLTVKEICHLYGIGHTSLGNYLTKYGIKRRRHG